jgi:hypothetical protein
MFFNRINGKCEIKKDREAGKEPDVFWPRKGQQKKSD